MIVPVCPTSWLALFQCLQLRQWRQGARPAGQGGTVQRSHIETLTRHLLHDLDPERFASPNLIGFSATISAKPLCSIVGGAHFSTSRNPSECCRLLLQLHSSPCIHSVIPAPQAYSHESSQHHKPTHMSPDGASRIARNAGPVVVPCPPVPVPTVL